MYKLFENPSEIFALTKEGTRKFYNNLYDEMILEGKDVVDYQEIKAMSTGVLCPDCNSSHVIKNGLQSGVQNYRCKTCGRQFRVTTGTFMYGVHEKDKMLEYIKCMSAGMSLRECAKIVHISLTTSFFWRHRILCAMQSFEDNVNFFGVVELEELLPEINKLIGQYSGFENQADSLGLKKEKFAYGLDLELMYKDMYYASEGYLWEKLQSNDIDPDRMEKDFVRMIGFWRKLYSRKHNKE